MTIILSALILMLGSSHYRQRDAAHHALTGCGRLALPHLRCAELSHNAEVTRRATILLEPYVEEIADVRARTIKPTNWPRLPWLSCDGPLTHYLAEAREFTRKAGVMVGGAPDWPEYREATRIWARSQLLQRRPVEEIQAEIDRMAGEERWWIMQNGHNYRPVIKLPRGYEE